MVRRSAFSFIELIFAIVIIGITVVSLPMMNQAISKGIDENIKQEAIFAAATKLNEAVTAHWDENSLETNQFDSLSRVIDHNSNCEDNSSLSTYRQMPGHINQPKHRKCLDSSSIGVSNANSNANVNALNDMVGTSPLYVVHSGSSMLNRSSYKQDYNSTVTVHQSPIFDGAANSDMKKIDVNITDGSVTVVFLTTYSANIGEIDYYKKEY